MGSLSGELILRASADADFTALRNGASRAIDIVVASAAFLFFAPLMLAVAAAIRLTGPGPILSGQRRIGKNGRTFLCWKFRSLATSPDVRLAPLRQADNWRYSKSTLIGGFLRNSSLDELPQLLNILKGEMSLVGPRPIVADEAERYGRYFVEYCRVRPGLTGLWQINCLKHASYRRRVAIDITYIRSKSIGLDLKILFLTMTRLLNGEM